MLVFQNLLENRMLMLFGPTQVFLRSFYCVSIMIAFSHDIISIGRQEAAIWRGIYSKPGALYNMLITTLRFLFGWFTLFVVLVYVITTDQEQPETPLDQTKDFTALLILI
jgi:hypothetical protein